MLPDDGCNGWCGVFSFDDADRVMMHMSGEQRPCAQAALDRRVCGCSLVLSASRQDENERSRAPCPCEGALVDVQRVPLAVPHPPARAACRGGARACRKRPRGTASYEETPSPSLRAVAAARCCGPRAESQSAALSFIALLRFPDAVAMVSGCRLPRIHDDGVLPCRPPAATRVRQARWAPNRADNRYKPRCREPLISFTVSLYFFNDARPGHLDVSQ